MKFVIALVVVCALPFRVTGLSVPSAGAVPNESVPPAGVSTVVWVVQNDAAADSVNVIGDVLAAEACAKSAASSPTRGKAPLVITEVRDVVPGGGVTVVGLLVT